MSLNAGDLAPTAQVLAHLLLIILPEKGTEFMYE
jgi:hypothetical protein